MPAIFLRTFLKQLLASLVNPASSSNESDALQLGIIHIHDSLVEIARGLVFVLSQVWGAKRFEWPLAQATGNSLKDAQSRNEDAISHVAFTILPNSLNYAVGYVFSAGIIPLRHELANLVGQFKSLIKWRQSIDTWRKRTVDPELRQWTAYQRWFKGWPLAILNTWHDWFAHPMNFAKWADPPIAGTMPGYLAGSGAKGDRDAMNAVLLSAWSEDSKVVQDYLNRWLLSPG